MDDEDSQDELINHNSSHCKGKRSATWAISDDSDDAEELSEEGESDSGEEDEEDEDDEEEENGEDEEDEKAGEACGGTSADLAAMSTDEDEDRCPICLNSFNSQPVATPENCEHYFCLDCILEWAKNANSCPVDRLTFNNIYLRICYGGKVKKMITVQKPVKEGQEEAVDLTLEQTNCEVCGASDREDRLLLCDGCDAGYHMECLTPPLDSVPVEEWFCPECQANNRQSGDLVEVLSESESLPSTARHASRRTQTAGPTRAIARTQQSERVRANVNRHRITQARSSQLAPTYLIESSWLDETINAVVAGLNTAVYIRDFTPRATARTRKRRKVRRKKTTSSAGKKGKTMSKGTKGKKRKVRRTTSRRKQVMKKVATPRSRIAGHLGMAKDKKGSSLPTVYRPSEQTLSGMRADIGAASLSIYGDPFDLDPFADQEEEEQQAPVPSLLEAKRRGISQSALRSHQPVARPVTASLSRRAVDTHHSAGVVEAAPVPDLLGSILSGQSMLLMDSSDVIINRDGSLKTSKPLVSSSLTRNISSISTLADAGPEVTPVMSPNQGDGFPSPHHHHNEGSSHCSASSRLLPHNSSNMQSSASPLLSSPQVHPRLQPPCPVRPTIHPDHRRATEPQVPSSSSRFLHQESSSKNKGTASPASPIKAPVKQMWEDVSVLPRIPKIKRDSGEVTNGAGHRKNSRSNSTTDRRSYSRPVTGMNNFAGDKGGQKSVDQHKGRNEGQARRPRPDTAASSSSSSSSSAFSNSFSSSSSSAASGQYPSSSSSSSSAAAVSFRIHSSGNSWHSRRLSVGPPSSSSRNTVTDLEKDREEAARKKQLHRDKQMLLASRTLSGNREEDSNNMYDPFNPTLSESCSSDEEAESTCNLDNSSQCATQDEDASSLMKEEPDAHSSDDWVCVANKTHNLRVIQEEASGAAARRAPSPASSPQEQPTVKKESRQEDSETERQTSCNAKVETDPSSHSTLERKVWPENVQTEEAKVSMDCSLVKIEIKTEGEQNGNHDTPSADLVVCKTEPSASAAVPPKKKCKTETKHKCESPAKSLCRGQEAPQESSSSESDRRRRRTTREPHVSDQGHQLKENKDGQPSSKQHRRRVRSSSDSSHADSSDGERRRKPRARSRSRSRDRRHSRSASSSSSRERSRRKTPSDHRKERRDGRDSDSGRRKAQRDKRRGRAHSRSPSRSRSRSRSRDRKRGRSPSRSRSRERKKERVQQAASSFRNKGESKSKSRGRHRSRSNSRERRKEEKSSKNPQKPSGSRVKDLKDTKELQAVKKEKEAVQRSHREEKVPAGKTQETSVRASSLKDNKKDKRDGGQREKEKKAVKDIKKEREPCLDMFEGSDLVIPVKKEDQEIEIHPPEVKRESDLEGSKDQPIKIEPHQSPVFKSESLPSKICHLPSAPSSPLPPVALSSSPPTAALADTQTPMTPAAAIKQEDPQSSDSDDEDFNVDVMLDSLDYERKSEPSAVLIKQEKGEEEQEEEVVAETGETAATVALGAKTKNQVKRVTWNIQEPEGPQPEKSSSKLALYKLKLKQEGLRRPASLCQDAAGAAGAPGGISGSSRHADSLNESSLTSGREDASDKDVSRKDKYLKKLHMQERAIEEVKLAIKPFYQKRDINKDEYKEILRKAVQKVCHSKSGEINPVKVGNLVKAYVDKYKHARKHRKGEDSGKTRDDPSADTP